MQTTKMERPILKLSSSDFLTGIAPSAHTERGGLFFSALGVTPIYDPGGTASVENGLLQAGPAPTNIGGATVDDVIFAADSGVVNSLNSASFYGADGNIYRLLTNGTFTEVKTGITSPKAGIKYWRNGLYYWNNADVGRTTDFSTFTDTAISPTGLASNIPAPHIFQDNLYYFHNAGVRLDRLTDVTTNEEDILDFEAGQIGTAISDDGVFLVVILTFNQQGADVFATNRVLFWDTFSSSWQREYIIQDPFIWSARRLGNSVICFGQYGIYEVSFGGGVRKILDRLIGFGNTDDLLFGYGFNRADIYNQQALIFGTDASVDTFGPLASDLPSAYLKPFKVPSGVGTPTCVFSKFAVGSVYVGTDGDKLYRYDFDGATRETSVSAQTVYFPLPFKVQIHKIVVALGEPLASGDAFDIDTKIDEDTAAVDYDSCSFAVEGAIRKKVMTPKTNKTPIPEDQISFVLNFTGGAPKIKKISVYGTPMEETSSYA